jgi:hypothetical protein
LKKEERGKTKRKRKKERGETKNIEQRRTRNEFFEKKRD